MIRRNFLNVGAAAFAVVALSAVNAWAVTITNADFDTLYKPGSTTITANISGGYTGGIGSGVNVNAATAVYSDSTTGSAVDVPGWTGGGATGVQDFPASAGQFPAGADTLPNAVYVQGPAFGGGNNNLVTSAALGSLAASTNYVLTIEVGWRNDVNPVASPVVLNLNANGSPLTPDASSSPALFQGSFVSFSRSFSAASLTSFVGQALTISFGVGSGASGQQVEFDTVRLTDTAVPEPASCLLLGLGAVGLFAVARRRVTR